MIASTKHIGLVWQAAHWPGSDISPRRSKSNAWERCLGQAALRRPHPNNPCLMLVKHLYCSEEKTPTVLNVHCTGLMFDSTFVWIFTNKLAGPNAMKIVNKSSQTQPNSNRHVGNMHQSQSSLHKSRNQKDKQKTCKLKYCQLVVV